jgi:hypothetical protein
MIAPRHDDLAAESVDGGSDPRVVGGDHDGAGLAGLAGAFVDVLDEVLACFLQERLARQSAGGMTRGDDDDGRHGLDLRERERTDIEQGD